MDYAWQTYGVQGVKMNLQGRVSEPDRLFLFHGGHGRYIEFKRLGKEPTKLQQHRAVQLTKWGYSVEVCDNQELAKLLIDIYAKETSTPTLRSICAKEMGTTELSDSGIPLHAV